MAQTEPRRNALLRRMKFGNQPIRYKLLFHFLMVAIIPSLVLGVMTDWVVNRIIERQMNENTLQLIAKVNKSLEFYVGSVQNTTYLLAYNPQVRAFLTESRPSAQTRGEALAFMRGFSTLQTEIAGMMIVKANGDYLSNDMYARASGDLTLETWYQEAVRGKGIFRVLGHPSKRNVTTHANYKDSEVVSAVRAILDPDTQKVLGVVLIDLKLRVIVETSQDVRLGKTGVLMVMDEKGEPIYVPRQLGFQKIPLNWLANQPSGEFVETVNGRKLQFIFRKTSFSDWATIGVFPTDRSAPEVRQIRLYVGTFVFIVGLLGITASFALSHSISRPIYRLMAFMQRAESGDLQTRYWGGGMDEIGMLGRSYNRMLAKIAELLQLAEKQERQKREAELRILQAQIKPHFLYNTLDTIQWMARKQGAADVAEMAEALARLFRIGLSKGNEFIPLAEEFDHVRSYLQIQKQRYQDKLRFTLDLDPSIAHLPVLKVVLQPIVENAIYHGIKERRGPGRIAVTGRRQAGRVVLQVADDGAGMDERTLARLRARLDAPSREARTEAAGTVEPVETAEAAGPGYGLSNIQARLQLTYGAENSGIAIESRKGEGTVVTLAYPAREEEQPWPHGK
jgi:two-component system sensor histidine kinase YesM